MAEIARYNALGEDKQDGAYVLYADHLEWVKLSESAINRQCEVNQELRRQVAQSEARVQELETDRAALVVKCGKLMELCAVQKQDIDALTP